MLRLNSVQEIDMLSRTFFEMAHNFGGYKHFGYMAYVDGEGRTAYETTIKRPTRKVRPAIWIDKTGKIKKPEGDIDVSELIPDCGSEEPQFYYITGLYSSDHTFGYSFVAMTGEGPFNEYYKMWMINMSISLELILRSNNIAELIKCLESASIRDGLTGLLNRSGFESKSAEAFYHKRDGELVSAIVVDMDGLKRINDVYGHTEGDFAIKSVANVIARSCGENDIAGRTGGDEFYIFLPDCDEERAAAVARSINEGLEQLESVKKKPYRIAASVGVYTAKSSDHAQVEDLIKISDERMYEIKRRRKAAI